MAKRRWRRGAALDGASMTLGLLEASYTVVHLSTA
jgi:hypothetical protein